jgi:hypothetical protein
MHEEHLGTSIDDFLKEEGIFEESRGLAINELAAWQRGKALTAENENKSRSLRDDKKVKGRARC